MTFGTLLTLAIVGVAASIGGGLGRKRLFERGPHGRNPADTAPPRAPRPIDWF